MMPGHGAAAWVPAGFCREVLDTGLVRGSPAQGCCCGLTHQCCIPSSTYKGLQGFHMGRVWPCCHQMGSAGEQEDPTRVTARLPMEMVRASASCRAHGFSTDFCLIACHNLPKPQWRGRGGCTGSTTTAAVEAPLCTWGVRPRAGSSLQPELGAGGSPWTAVNGNKAMFFLCKKF